MITILDKTKCNGCHACAAVCPKKCIATTADTEGFLYPKVDETACISCGLCDSVCPVMHQDEPLNENLLAYAAINKDEQTRMQSSSGGIFTLLAKYVLQKGGVVFGAAFNEKFEVEHKCVETEEELAIFRGSKYVQSKIGDSFAKAKTFLEQGRVVLFTGTPCQIGGLLAYLKKPYDNLYTQDIICHGVPSPMVWQKYVEYRKNQSESTPQSISFRNKDEGWKVFSLRIDFDDGSIYRKTLKNDLMMQAFLKNLCLRPSCYDCAFKSKARQSDITLADFWGIENVLPEMDDDKGTSLVCIHSAKGQALWKELQPYIISRQVNADEAITYNPAMIQSVARPKNREVFFKALQKGSFEKAVNKATKRSLLRRILGKIKRILFR